MKNNFKFLQIFLLMCGVCGAGTDEVKTVLVMEGESVTLNPDLTQIQGIIRMKWRFGDSHPVIAQTDRNDISYPSVPEMFVDRLKLDQTGSLTITNMKTKHSGLYKLEINHNRGTSDLNFSVTVYESPAVIDAFKGETKSVSETEGESVTLQTDTETHGDELIVWRFGDEGKLIAKHDLEAKSSPSYDPDERFRDRLKLNNQTGSLTITNTRTTDSGVYKVKISSSNQTLQKRFTVTVSTVPAPPLSPAAVAGIVVGVVLLVLFNALVLYYLLKVYELQKLMTKTVKEGEYFTLTPGIEINKDDQIQWLFGDEKTLIAEIKRGTGEITVSPNRRFRDRLEINKKTGSLTIRDTRAEDTGVYELKIRGGRLVQNLCRRLVQNLNKRFIVSVREQVNKSVLEGRSVTLNCNTEIQKNDKIQWKFGEKLIAEMTGENLWNPQWTDEFRGQMKLHPQTGSLTIKRTRPEHSGLYELEIISSDYSTFRLFSLIVCVYKSVLKGRPVTLNYGTELQKDEKIQWKFEEKLIAEMTGENCENPQWTDEFRDQMKLDPQTGSLIIQQTRSEQTGLYKLEIKTSDYSTSILFSLLVFDEEKSVSVMEGEDVTLHVNPKIQTGDKIFWMFGNDNRLVAKNTEEECEEESEFSDVRFKPNVDLNHQTGDLTIKTIKRDHIGKYKLKIIRNGKASFKIFKVTLSGLQVNESVLKGRPVTLKYKTEIQEDDKIQWKFGEKLIVEMTGENRENPQWTDEFRDQMKLDPLTGSLIIQQTRPEHSGLYKLEIKTSDKSTFRLFMLTVFDEVKSVSVMKEANVTLHVNPKIQTGDKIFWMFGDDNRPIANNTEEKCEEESEFSDVKFKPNVDLNHQTGDLTIRTIETIHTGKYKLKIIRNGKASFKLFKVTLSGRQVNKSVLKGRSVTLNYDTKIQKDDKIQWKFGEKLITEMTGENRENPQWTDEFRDQMKLDPQTGSLTIKQTRSEHSGLYKLEIISRDYSAFRVFRIIVCGQLNKSVLKGDSVTLYYDTEIQKDDKIQWKFGEKLIAKMTGENCENPQWTDDEFRDQMKLDPQTGSLIIQQTRSEHSGLYKIEINSSDYSTFRVFRIIVCDEQKSVPVMMGKDVILHVNPKIQTGDKIFWMFGRDNSLVAKNTEEEFEEDSEFRDYRFKDKVDLNRHTGDLTIKTIRSDHIGEYKLKIIRNGKSSFKLFTVTVSDKEKKKPLMKEKRENESVTVEMPLLKAEDRDRVNEQESLL